MGTANQFEKDVFISYAQVDDQPFAPGQAGWVSNLHRALELRLEQLRGKKPKIWREAKEQTSDSFSDALAEELTSVALLVSVLSPRYVRSTACIQELREFCRALEGNGGVRVAETQPRLFKVVKTPIERKNHPPEIQTAQTYEFYDVDMSGRPIEYSQMFGAEAERNFWAKLNDLAYDISKTLDLLTSSTNGSNGRSQRVGQTAGLLESEPPTIAAPGQIRTDEAAIRTGQVVASTGICVYLARTTSDLKDQWDNVRRELEQRGHTVLPQQTLPEYGPDLEQVIRESLAQSKLSVHLIGKRYGWIPENADRSIIELQHALAVEHSRQQRGFARIIWVPEGLEPEDDRQQALIQTLQNDAEYMQTGIEELKTFIQDRLKPRSISPLPELDQGPKRVYLICTEPDEASLTALDDYLFDQGFEVIRPLFDGEEADLRQDHQTNLCDCDAVLIYYGSGNEAWLRTKLSDLKKAPGYGRTKPFLAKAVYVTGPETARKQAYRTHEATVIKCFADFSPVLLTPFTSLLQASGGLP